MNASDPPGYNAEDSITNQKVQTALGPSRKGLPPRPKNKKSRSDSIITRGSLSQQNSVVGLTSQPHGLATFTIPCLSFPVQLTLTGPRSINSERGAGIDQVPPQSDEFGGPRHPPELWARENLDHDILAPHCPCQLRLNSLLGLPP